MRDSKAEGKVVFRSNDVVFELPTSQGCQVPKEASTNSTSFCEQFHCEEQGPLVHVIYQQDWSKSVICC